VDQARSHTTKNIEDEVSNVAKPIFDVIPENIKKPHVRKDVKESSVKKHRGQKGKKLLKRGKVSGEPWIGISYRNNAKEKKGLLQIGALNELP
jgi:hypothetical protein